MPWPILFQMQRAFFPKVAQFFKKKAPIDYNEIIKIAWKSPNLVRGMNLKIVLDK